MSTSDDIKEVIDRARRLLHLNANERTLLDISELLLQHLTALESRTAGQVRADTAITDKRPPWPKSAAYACTVDEIGGEGLPAHIAEMYEACSVDEALHDCDPIESERLYRCFSPRGLVVEDCLRKSIAREGLTPLRPRRPVPATLSPVVALAGILPIDEAAERAVRAATEAQVRRVNSPKIPDSSPTPQPAEPGGEWAAGYLKAMREIVYVFGGHTDEVPSQQVVDYANAAIYAKENAATPPSSPVSSPAPVAGEWRAEKTVIRNSEGTAIASAHSEAGARWLVDSHNRELAALRAQKDGAYAERNRCVAFMARMALALGWKAGKARHPEEDADWENDWRNIVFIDTPAGQLSWHFHDNEWTALGCDELPDYGGAWDGHTTDEKYARMRVTAALRAPASSGEVAWVPGECAWKNEQDGQWQAAYRGEDGDVWCVCGKTRETAIRNAGPQIVRPSIAPPESAHAPAVDAEKPVLGLRLAERVRARVEGMREARAAVSLLVAACRNGDERDGVGMALKTIDGQIANVERSIGGGE